jgi:hypothetical protein
LLPHPFGTNLSSVADPQLELQAVKQTLEPAGMSAGFHPHTHPSSLPFEFAVELLGFFRMKQPVFAALPGFGVDECNLLEARMIITALYLVCICPIRSLCVSGGLDRDSAGGRSHP